MSPEQEVRVAAVHAAVLHHKHFTAKGNGSTYPYPATPEEVLTTARKFTEYINGPGMI